VASLAGVTGWYAIVPFIVAVAAGLGLGLATTRFVVTARDAWGAAALAAAWAIVAAGAPQPVDLGGRAGEYGAYRSAGAIAAVGLAALLAWWVFRETVSRASASDP